MQFVIIKINQEAQINEEIKTLSLKFLSWSIFRNFVTIRVKCILNEKLSISNMVVKLNVLKSSIDKTSDQ